MKQMSLNTGFWVVGATYLVTMAFATVPSPLYVLYQQRGGFTPFMVTIVFAVYALATMASLYFVGHLSDWIGRRRVLALAMAFELLSALVFLSGTSLAVLIVARAICGIAMGLIAGTATAYVFELHAVARPKASKLRGELVASIAVMGGLGLGSLVSGLLTLVTTAPLQVPYELFLVVMAALTALLPLVPETTKPKDPLPHYRPQRIMVPAKMRSAFFAAAGASLALYAMLAVFSSVAPIFMAKTLGLHSHALAGAVTFAVYVSGAIAQVGLRDWSVKQLLAGGLYGMMIGMILLVLGVSLQLFWLFVVAGSLIGAGTGVLFKGCMTVVAKLAPPNARSETMAALFVTGYLGLSIPVLVLGVATQRYSLAASLQVFTAVFLAVLLLVRRRLLRAIA